MNIPQNKEEVEGFLTSVGLNSVFKKQILDNFDIDFYKERILRPKKERIISCAGIGYHRLIIELKYLPLLTCFIICNTCLWSRTVLKHDSPKGFMFYVLVIYILKGEATYLGLQLFNLGEDKLEKRTLIL